MNGRPRRRPPIGAIVGLVLALGSARTDRAFGHGFEPALLDLTEGHGGQYAVLWKTRPGPARLVPRFPEHCRSLGSDAAPGPPEVRVQLFRIDCAAMGLGGATISVDGLEASTDVVVRVAWRDGRVTSGVLRPDTPALRLPTGPAAEAGGVLRAYVGLGIEHILLGVDHLLFVLGLVLLAEGWGTLVRTVSAFTVAHSLTLALAAVEALTLPQAPVDATIALSIVVLALEVLRDPAAKPTLTRRAPWLVAFGFGLLHGLGFASALAAVGLPPDHVPLALFAFNVGVELGQLVFVVAVLPAVVLGRRLAVGRPLIARLPAYAIGAVAVAWTLERLLAMRSAAS